MSLQEVVTDGIYSLGIRGVGWSDVGIRDLVVHNTKRERTRTQTSPIPFAITDYRRLMINLAKQFFHIGGHFFSRFCGW